ncbi:MAG: TRAP-type C4-dicarboxylate transport system, substrate-binding protein [bacterium]|nr:TRAP-type C4-dicarboxylate transport system, substrate-binding protein [bacterium]
MLVRMRLVPALLALTLSSFAHAEPTTLRMATIAPQGTGWAREFAAWARDIEAGTRGAVHVKMYYAAIGGDEFTVLDRIKREQLDGAIASEGCVRLAPSLRVTRIFGLFQSRQESTFVLSRLQPVLEREFLRAGYIDLGVATLGPEMLFTRQPIRDLTDLRKTLLWIWDADDALRVQAPALGLHVVATPLESAARAYDEKSVDGFISMPEAALAFQWSAQASYLEDIALSYRNGCVFVTSRSFDALPIEAQRYIRTATAKLRGRLDDRSRREDELLLGGLFARQGLKTVAVSERFRRDFFGEAREMRGRLAPQLVPPKLLEEVLSWLADYRAEHQLGR